MLETDFGLLPYINQEWIIEQYNRVEILRLELWDKIYQLKRDYEIEFGSLDTKSLDSEATFNKNVLKIVVKDYLPRKCFVKARDSQNLLRYTWLKSVIDAINTLKSNGANPVFEKAHCIITTYLPRKINWDVDNRVISFIINSLRYANVIIDDTADKLAYTVIGKMDKDFPRTEIIVLDHVKFMQKIAEINM